jgi:hypothetical protein
MHAREGSSRRSSSSSGGGEAGEGGADGVEELKAEEEYKQGIPTFLIGSISRQIDLALQQSRAPEEAPVGDGQRVDDDGSDDEAAWDGRLAYWK